MENTVDSLQIDIVSTTTDASKSLNAVVSSLKKLDRISKSNSFNIISNRLKKISEISFDKLNRQLNNITKNIKTLSSYKKFLDNLELGNPTIETTSITKGIKDVLTEVERGKEQIIQTGESFGETQQIRPEWLDGIQSQCESLIEGYKTAEINIKSAKNELNKSLNAKREEFGSQGKFTNAEDFVESLDDKLSKLSIRATLLQERLDKLKDGKSSDNKTAWEQLQVQLLGVKLQYTGLEQAADKHTNSVDKLGEAVEKTRKPLGKLIAQFGRVAMYRAIRFILSEIAQGVTTGLQNLAKFSDEANIIMSAYKTEFLYIQNSLGSALLPIMQSLLPLVETVGDGFVDIANSIGVLGAWFNGEDTFLKAKKYAQDYKKSLDEIKKSTLGIDEINILGKVDTNNDYTKMFEEVKIDGGDIGEAIGKLAGLAGTVSLFLAAFKGKELLQAFKNFKNNFKDFMKNFKNQSSFTRHAASLAAIAVQAGVCYNSFYNLFTSADTLGEKLTNIGAIAVSTGGSMAVLYASFGVPGLVVGAVVTALSAIAAGIKAIDTEIETFAMEAFYEDLGEGAISLDNLYESFTKDWKSATQDFNQSMDESDSIISGCKTSIHNSNVLLGQFSDRLTNISEKNFKITMSTSDIDDFIKKFNNLNETELREKILTMSSVDLNNIIKKLNDLDERKLNTIVLDMAYSDLENVLTGLDSIAKKDFQQLTLDMSLKDTTGLLTTLNSLTKEQKLELQLVYDKQGMEGVIRFLETMDSDISNIAESFPQVKDAVSTLADDIQTVLDTEMKVVTDNFVKLWAQAGVDASKELDGMKSSFLSFIGLTDGITSQLEATIQSSMAEIMLDSDAFFSDESKVATFNQAVQKLSKLGSSVSSENQAAFNLAKSDALSGRINFESEVKLQNFFADFEKTTLEYLDSINRARDSSIAGIETYMSTLDTLYEYGDITDSQYEAYRTLFQNALDQTNTAYDAAINKVYEDVAEVYDAIQIESLRRLNKVAEEAVNNWDNKGWFIKFLYALIGIDGEDWVNQAVQKAIKKSNSIVENIKGSLKVFNMDDTDYTVWLDKAYDELKNFRKFFNGMGSGSFYDLDDGEFHSAGGSAKKTAEIYKQAIENKINEYANGLKNVASAIGDKLDSFGKSLKIPGFATGGFPEDDSIIAVNPTEIVGKMSNGKNVVANNYQIVDGIKQGVAEALGETGATSGGDWIIQIVDTNGKVKGETIISAAERKNRRDGKTIIPIGG